MRATVYNLTTGLILGYVDGPDVSEEVTAEELWNEQGVGALYGDLEADTETSYVLDGIATPRPELPVQQNGNTLTVPPSTEYFVRGPAAAEGVTEDGVLEFEFAEPGTYTVTLRLFPYLDAEVIFEG